MKQTLVSRGFAAGDDALIPQAVVRVVSGITQTVLPVASETEPEPLLSAALREPEKFTLAFLSIRRALTVQEGDNVLIDALEALAFLEDRFHRFRQALRDWLLTSPASFPPQIIRLQFLYLETGPRTFQRTADRVQAELREY